MSLRRQRVSCPQSTQLSAHHALLQDLRNVIPEMTVKGPMSRNGLMLYLEGPALSGEDVGVIGYVAKSHGYGWDWYARDDRTYVHVWKEDKSSGSIFWWSAVLLTICALLLYFDVHKIYASGLGGILRRQIWRYTGVHL